MTKELKLNEYFTEKEQCLKVVLASDGCGHCYYIDDCARGLNRLPNRFHLFCMAKYRLDNRSVRFVKTMRV